MNSLSANEAKTQFGDMIIKVQRAPIQINKNGKPVAVVISMEEYERMESLKFRLLQQRALQAKADMESGDTFDGELFFDDLESGKFD